MEHKNQIMIIFLALALLILGNISKGSELQPSKLFPECSVISFIVFFGCMFINVFISTKNVQALKIEEKLSDRKVLLLGSVSFVSGTITSFGISGSLIFATGLSAMNLTPG